MKGKKVLKVFLVTMIVVTMLAQVAAFADTPYYTTNTVYDNATGKAKVTSTIYGVGSGEEVTFLVEDAENNILYIDQINVADYTATDTESASFTYLVNADEADGTASVKFATTSNAASAVTPSDGGVSATPAGDDDTIVLDSANLSYTVVGNGTVFVDDVTDVYVDATNASGSKSPVYSGQIVTFHCAPDAGYEFAGYQVDAGEKIVADAGNDKFTYTADGTATALTIYFEKIESVTSESVAITVDETVVVADAEVVSARAISQFVSITTGAEKASEYGILVSKDASAIGGISASSVIDDLSYSESNTVRKFAALGSYENKYAVKLVDTRTEGNYFADGTVYIRAYAKAPNDSSDAVYAISDVYEADLINGTVTNITGSSN